MDKMRWRYDDTHPINAHVFMEDVIEIGNLLWLDDYGLARPWSACNCDSRFKDRFLGVAMQRAIKGCTAMIRVATAGVFEFEIAPNRCVVRLGDPVRAVGNGNVEHCSDDCPDAIARVIRTNPVYVRIYSTIMRAP